MNSRNESRDAAEGRPPGLEELARRMRGSLASLRAASETLERYPGMEIDQRRRLHGVVADEAARLADLVDRLERLATGTRNGERRRTAATELLVEVREAIAQPGLEVEVTRAEEDAGTMELEIDRGALTAAVRGFVATLRKDFAVVRCRLRAEEVDRHLLLDCAWRADPSDAPRLQDWQGEALEIGRDAPALRRTVRAHGGEAWFDLDRKAGPEGPRAHVRILLPLAGTD